MLGHHSPDFTLRVYAHMIPGEKVAALDLGQELSSPPFRPSHWDGIGIGDRIGIKRSLSGRGNPL
jgi:hypothetical protein